MKKTIAPRLETLNDRTLPSTASLTGGVLTITGTNLNDVIVVKTVNNTISIVGTPITVGATTKTSVPKGDVTSIVVNSLAGNEIAATVALKVLEIAQRPQTIANVAALEAATRQRFATLIQRQFRLRRFRARMARYRRAALTLQHFHRSMAARYLFLRQRTIVYKIQCLYRRVYLVRRHSAALTIQCRWRVTRAQRHLTQLRIEWQAAEEVC